MSDEDRDIDIESDEEDDTVSSTGKADLQFASQAEKRAHHNALERKRRDHIKDSFTSLRESVPTLQGEKSTSKASRAQILKKAADYIEYMRRKNTAHQRDIDDLKKQNNTLESQIEAMEKTKAAGEFSDMTNVQDLDRLTEDNLNPSDGEETESEDDVHDTKRQKVSA